MRVRITVQAESDLDEIAAWIAQDSQERAFGFIEELLERCKSLSSHADRFPIAHDVGGRIVRKMTHGRYLIFYFQLDDHIEVGRVIHASRDWAALLDQ